jgi:hypothetical protein
MTTIPTELRALDEWVVWRFERRDGKPTKVPYAVATGRRASVSDSGSWTTFDKARAFASAHADGIGFVFTEHDPFTGQRLRPAPIDREDLHLRPLPCHGERFATLAGVTQFKVEHLRRARVWWR